MIIFSAEQMNTSRNEKFRKLLGLNFDSRKNPDLWKYKTANFSLHVAYENILQQQKNSIPYQF